MSAKAFSVEDFGPNAGYVAEILKLYESGSPLVDSSWRNFFGGESKSNGSSTLSREAIFAQLQIFQLIAAYRGHGHLAAKSNPLKFGSSQPELPADLLFESYLFEPAQLEHKFFSFGITPEQEASPKVIFDRLQQLYCGTVGFEFEHLSDKRARDWFIHAIEKDFSRQSWFSKATRLNYLHRLVEAESLDMACHTRFIGAKRFSILGGETFVVLLQRAIESSAALGIEDITLSMAHRGRINAVVSFAGKPIIELISEFEDSTVASKEGGGDVKYHLGGTIVHSIDGKSVRLSVPPNPSHLEFVNSVANGIVRAKQDEQYSGNRQAALALAIHGDSSFAGQGIVAEAFNFSRLKGYETGGTVHIIINNQIGFTTSSSESRSTTYCSDIAKGFNVPVFHVNADDVEAAAWVMDAALRFRQEFKQDVVIDLVCSRKFGHNEGDDPTFTQPLLYKELSARKSNAVTYSQQLIDQKVASSEEVEAVREQASSKIKQQFELSGKAAVIKYDFSINEQNKTEVAAKRLQEIAAFLLPDSEDFEPHPKLKNILLKRIQAIEQDKGIDWGLAEALAFGSLLTDGISIRISGQDSGRGTFSHRHLELHDHRSLKRVYPLTEFARSVLAQSEAIKTKFEVFNSPLSEAAVMGFDFGYAVQSPKTLVLWEAQFGDFANGAQVIIDQFLASSEQKWNQRSGLVLLLPHGFEGQGPEHSSARLERFLQLCSHNNMSVTYPSSPAQFFHLLRRQALSSVKRPLVVMTPKSMLRLPDAGSSLSDMSTGSFRKVREFGKQTSKKQPVICCSGKVLYSMKKAIGEIAKIITIEQLYPWPKAELKEALSGATKVLWVQEEPQNMGAAQFVLPLISELGVEVSYIGRESAAGVATGSPSWHLKEEQEIFAKIKKALA